MSVHAEPQYDPAHPPGPRAEDTSIGALTSQLTEHLSRLVRDEMALAQLEAKQRAKRFGIGLGMFGVGGVFLFFGASAGVAAAILGLANVMPGWLAALVVAGALMVLAGIVALTGKKSIDRGSPPVPTQAMQSVREDAAAVREAIKQ
jgi:hypothetical protein